jgi:DNA-binding IclR family transcriptional regulator
MHNARKTLTTAGDEAIAIASQGPTKSATVLTLLQREQGVMLPELVAATGWQPHATRAMLTGLRKKGHAIERRTRDEHTCYHIPKADA